MLKVMLHETIRNDDFQRNTALQHCFEQLQHCSSMATRIVPCNIILKTTIGLISKKATLHVQHTFFVHFFAVVLHNYNVKLPETSQLHVFWRKCRACSRSLFFFHCRLLFSSCIRGRCILAFLILSPPLQNFFVVLPTKKKIPPQFVCLFVFFLSLALDLCRPFLAEFRSPAAYFLFFCLSLVLYQWGGYVHGLCDFWLKG